MNIDKSRLAQHHFSVIQEWREKYSDLVDEIFQKNRIETLIDIGANTGAVIDFLLSKNSFTEIYAFEPLGSNFEVLNSFSDILEKKGTSFFPFPYAIYYGCEESLACGTGDGNTGGMFLKEVENEFAKNTNTQETGEIFLCKKLEDFLPQDMQVDLCKIDVEGSEWNILKNSEFIKNRVKNILLEFHWISESEAMNFISENMKKFKVNKIVSNTIWMERIESA